MRIGILTVSDRSSRGERRDEGGPALEQRVREAWREVDVLRAVVPDEIAAIGRTLSDWADREQCPLILTTGGTGLAARDVTPEATRAVLDRELPGFGEAMRLRTLANTPLSILSRATAGTRGRTLIINLPGSPKGAVECLEAVLPAVGHAVEILLGTIADCAAHHADR
jgi:molybdenum cofactor synthesis domain-containing protein